MATRDELVARIAARGRTRMSERGPSELSGTVNRLASREDGVQRSASPDVQYVARGDGVSSQGATDLRTEIARQVAELTMLDADQAMLRASEPQAARESDGGGGAPPEGAQKIFEAWVSDMKEKGFKQPEIEELLADQIRGVRGSQRAQASARAVGRTIK